MSNDESVIIDDILEFVQEYINPGLAMHGGYMQVVNFDEEKGSLDIMLGGGCQGCSYSKQTLTSAIITSIQEEFPSIQFVNDITNHSEGESPYHQ